MIVDIQEATSLLLADQCVGLPTETVYGLAAKYSSSQAIDRIFSLKNRPQDNPLIVHIATMEQLTELVTEVTPTQKKLIDSFWPGPLTLLFQPSASVLPTITAGSPYVAVRMPSHPVFSEILTKTGPLVAPSANLSGRPSPTRSVHLHEDFGSTFPVVDGGWCKDGVESTIIHCMDTYCSILRIGAISTEDVQKIVPILDSETTPLVPGKKYKHYAPKTPLYALEESPAEVIIGFKDRFYPSSQHVFLLGRSDNPEQIQRNLFGVLRAVDYCGFEKAHVDMNFPDSGLFAATKERLLRAISAQEFDNK